MKNMSEKENDIKAAWETFIQSLTVEYLLASYVESHSIYDYMSGTIIIGGENEIGFETRWEYMAILHGDVWRVFRTPLELWGKSVHERVDTELLRMLDFEVVEDFIRVLEL